MFDNDVMVSNDNIFLKKYNNIYISGEQLEILNKYGIDINKYSSVNELIFDIENYLNNNYGENDDLEWVSQTLSEFNYYNNTNK